MVKIREGDALVVVDIQNDFAHLKGTLYVQGAEGIFPVVHRWINAFVEEGQQIFLTKDYHPIDHISFKNETNPNGWPPHCVANTWGAKIHDAIMDIRAGWDFVLKGQDKNKEEYSAFAPSDGLESRLNSYGLKRIFVVGLATDYCVEKTVVDGLVKGFKVVVIENGIAAVNINEGDGTTAIRVMRDAGAKIYGGLL